jgi:hypothetical protein
MAAGKSVDFPVAGKTHLQVAAETSFYCMMELVARLGPGPVLLERHPVAYVRA